MGIHGLRFIFGVFIMAILLANWLGYSAAFLSHRLRVTTYLISSLILFFIFLTCYLIVVLMICATLLVMLPYFLFRLIPVTIRLVGISVLLLQAELRYVKFAKKMYLYSREKVRTRDSVEELGLFIAEGRRNGAKAQDLDLSTSIELTVNSLVRSKEEMLKLNNILSVAFKSNQRKLQTFLKLSE